MITYGINRYQKPVHVVFDTNERRDHRFNAHLKRQQLITPGLHQKLQGNCSLAAGLTK